MILIPRLSANRISTIDMLNSEKIINKYLDDLQESSNVSIKEENVQQSELPESVKNKI